MNITLIYPGNEVSALDTFGEAGFSKIGGESNFIPHGLASIAAYLSKYGYKINYIDIRKIKSWDDFQKTIIEDKSIVYGITSTTVDFGNAITCAKLIKELKNDSKIIVGGVHPTLKPEDALKFDFFDHVVCGEGEIAILEILESIEYGINIGRLVKGTPCNLSEIPHIDRELFNHKEGEMIHPFINDMRIPSATIITSRGCPFNCNFCQPAEREIFGGKVRLRDVGDVIDELVEIKGKYGLQSFLIHDDLFLISKKRIEKFGELYKESGVDAEFYCQGRVDLIIKYKKQIKMLADIGLKGILIGFESGSDKVLKFINKGSTVEQNLEAAKICKELGIKIWANYMFGLPNESYVEMIKTALMISKIKPEYHSSALFTPYPKTNLYEYCKKNDLLRITNYSEYRRDFSKGKKIKGVNYVFIKFLNYLLIPLLEKVRK